MAGLWVLCGPKSGDNAQVLRAAEASGLAFVTKTIAFLPGHVARKPFVRPTLAGVDLARSDRLGAPWPDVVLVIGRHLSRVALWIKRQSCGATRIVLFNIAKGRARDFDLIVLPPFYRSRERANLMRIRTPVIGIDPQRVDRAGEAFAASALAAPRPLHAFLVGGDMGQRSLDPGFVAGVLRQMRAGFAAEGAIHVCTSPRTPPKVVAALEAELGAADRLHRWQPGAAVSAYLGLLAHADSFTVTADSLSMLFEVARLGKPLVIAEAPPAGGIAGAVDRALATFRRRDLGLAIKLLCDGGFAVRLGQPPITPRSRLPDDTGLVAQRLRQLAGLDAVTVGSPLHPPLSAMETAPS